MPELRVAGEPGEPADPDGGGTRRAERGGKLAGDGGEEGGGAHQQGDQTQVLGVQRGQPNVGQQQLGWF